MRDQIVATARQYLNTPFKFAGRTRKGVDCIFIGLAVARDLKMPGWREMWADQEIHRYPRVRPVGFMRRKLNSFVADGFLRRVDINRLQSGDFVLRFGGFGHDHHVCLLTEIGMIEARNIAEPNYPHGRVVECGVTEADYRTFMGGYQFAGVA